MNKNWGRGKKRERERTSPHGQLYEGGVAPGAPSNVSNFSNFWINSVGSKK